MSTSRKLPLVIAILGLAGPLIDTRKTVTEETLTSLKEKLEAKDEAGFQAILAEKKVPLAKMPESWAGDVLFEAQPRIIDGLEKKPERFDDLLDALDKNLTPQQLLEQWGLGANNSPQSAGSGQKVDAKSDDEPLKVPDGYAILMVSDKIAAYDGAYTIPDDDDKRTIDKTPRVLPVTDTVARWLSAKHVQKLTEKQYSEWKAAQTKAQPQG